MIDNFNFEDQKEFIKKLSGSMNRHDLEAFLLSAAQDADMEKFKTRAAEEILHITKPSDIIPEIYGDYREIVHDGILFLLSNLSSARLIKLVVDQLLLKEDAAVEERLLHLAGHIPTLHKLGQIIARNRNVEASFRKWLICLENDFHSVSFAELRDKISNEMSDVAETFSIRMDNEVLAEASVGAVISFMWTDPDTGKSARGVFKTLKPLVKEHLDEELKLLDELAFFFDKKRDHYTLKNFRFVETFKDIKIALEEEIDLRGEQENLKKALPFYGKNTSATLIPRLLPFSTENITVMEYMKGCKITDAYMNSEDRKMCARALYKTVICHPLFSHEAQTLFHGDPHAGNIYAFEDEIQGDMKVVLLDWSQAGYLSKRQRMNILWLAIGVVLNDENFILDAIGELSDENFKEDPLTLKKVDEIISEIMASPEYEDCQLVKKIFLLIDQTTLRGIRFPRDLLLFRKAFFTLDGVLYDIDPAFDPDIYTIRLLEKLFVEELPRRWLYFLFPHSDHPEHYKTLLSNNDVQMLVHRVAFEIFKKAQMCFPY